MECAERAGKAKLLFSRAPETRHGRPCLGVDQYSRYQLIVGLTESGHRDVYGTPLDQPMSSMNMQSSSSAT